MADATVELNVLVTGGAQVKKSMKGMVDEAKKANKQLKQEDDKLEQFRRDALKRLEGVRKRTERIAVDDVRKAERQKQVLQAKTAREFQTNMLSAIKRVGRGMRDFIRNNKAAIGGGLAAGFISASRRAQGFAALPTVESGFESAAQFKAGSLALQTSAGLSDEQRLGFEKIFIEVGEKFGQTAEANLAAARFAEREFGSITAFTDNAELFNQVAAALGTDVDVASESILGMVKQLNIAEEDIPRAIGLTTQAILAGRLDLEDLGGTFSEVLNKFSDTFKSEGERGQREALATFELLQRGGASPGKAATEADQLLDAIQDPKVEKRLRQAGTSLRDPRDNAILPIDILLERIASIPALRDNPAARAKVFGKEGGDVVGRLLSQIKDDPEAFRKAINVDAALGIEASREGAERFVESSVGARQAKQIEVQNNIIENFDNIADVSLKMAGFMAELQSNFPLLSQAALSARDALLALGGISILKGVLGGGGGDRGGGGVPVPGGGGPRLGKLGKLGAAGAVLGALAVGVEAGTVIDERFGLSRGAGGLDKKRNQFREGFVISGNPRGDDAERATTVQGITPEIAAAENRRVAEANEANADRTEENTRAMNRLINALTLGGASGDAGAFEDL